MLISGGSNNGVPSVQEIQNLQINLNFKNSLVALLSTGGWFNLCEENGPIADQYQFVLSDAENPFIGGLQSIPEGTCTPETLMFSGTLTVRESRPVDNWTQDGCTTSPVSVPPVSCNINTNINTEVSTLSIPSTGFYSTTIMSLSVYNNIDPLSNPSYYPGSITRHYDPQTSSVSYGDSSYVSLDNCTPGEPGAPVGQTAWKLSGQVPTFTYSGFPPDQVPCSQGHENRVSLNWLPSSTYSMTVTPIVGPNVQVSAKDPLKSGGVTFTTPPVTAVSVPNFVGMCLPQALAAIGLSDLTVGKQTVIGFGHLTQDYLVTTPQTPSAGLVPVGSPIDLTETLQTSGGNAVPCSSGGGGSYSSVSVTNNLQNQDDVELVVNDYTRMTTTTGESVSFGDSSAPIQLPNSGDIYVIYPFDRGLTGCEGGPAPDYSNVFACSQDPFFVVAGPSGEATVVLN